MSLMYDTRSFSKVPEKPGIYALYDGFLGNKCVYVGKSGNIKNRIRDHLILRISTVTAGFTATSINVENLTRVRWWTDEKFGDGDYLDAAETLAFQILNNPLFKLKNFFGTSHRSSLTNEGILSMGLAAINGLDDNIDIT